MKPLDDARVTRALRLLVDHDEFLTGWVVDWYGRGRHGGVLRIGARPWDFTHDEYSQMLEWKKPKDDAAKEAISLLSAAGYTKDNPLTIRDLRRQPPVLDRPRSSSCRRSGRGSPKGRSSHRSKVFDQVGTEHGPREPDRSPSSSAATARPSLIRTPGSTDLHDRSLAQLRRLQRCEVRRHGPEAANDPRRHASARPTSRTWSNT